MDYAVHNKIKLCLMARSRCLEIIVVTVHWTGHWTGLDKHCYIEFINSGVRMTVSIKLWGNHISRAT